MRHHRLAIAASLGVMIASAVAVRAQRGPSATALEDFGLEAAKKTGPKTVHAKVVAAVKGKATRAKRGTMGKRQRKKVKAG